MLRLPNDCSILDATVSVTRYALVLVTHVNNISYNCERRELQLFIRNEDT